MDDIYLDLAKQKREALKARLKRTNPDYSEEQLDETANRILTAVPNSITPEQQGLQEPEVSPLDIITAPKMVAGATMGIIKKAGQTFGKEASELAVKKMAKEGAEAGTGMYAKKIYPDDMSLKDRIAQAKAQSPIRQMDEPAVPNYGKVTRDLGPEEQIGSVTWDKGLPEAPITGTKQNISGRSNKVGVSKKDIEKVYEKTPDMTPEDQALLDRLNNSAPVVEEDAKQRQLRRIFGK